MKVPDMSPPFSHRLESGARLILANRGFTRDIARGKMTTRWGFSD